MDAPARSESQASEEDEEYSNDDDGSQTVQRSSAEGDEGTATATVTNNNAVVTAVPTLDSLRHLRPVGQTNAVCWQLSSAKPGNGVEQLRDPSLETYWQSDGTLQPHWAQLSFRRRIPITHVAIYLDYHVDESYTPKCINIETGTTVQDLISSTENTKIEFHEPAGWCIIPVIPPPDALGNIDYVKAHLVRVNVLSMHQNGRDTHVRRLEVFTTRQPTNIPRRLLEDTENQKERIEKPTRGLRLSSFTNIR